MSLSLFTPIGCRLYQTCEDGFDTRQIERTGCMYFGRTTRQKLFVTGHLSPPVTNIFGRKLLALRIVMTGVFWSGFRRIRRIPCCFHPVQRRNPRLSCCGVPGGLEGQNTGSGATKLFGQELAYFPFPASFFFPTAHFLQLL